MPQTLAALTQQNVPRYTSYPTAPHFNASVDASVYAQWLAELPPDASLSLYLHVPFCDELCLYCGCNTAVVRKEAPRVRYAKLLQEEIAMVAGRIGRRQKVCRIHWGGGTPTALPAACLIEVTETLKKYFEFTDDIEVAVEFDPRHLAADRLAALPLMGVSRASLGVQDFDQAVQEAIGRVQSFEQTLEVANSLRGVGVKSLNLDLIYGLPCQTVEGATETARQALLLSPDRIAVFGYAHVPWMKPHQKLLPESSLPSTDARLAQREAIDAVLVGAGFCRIGLDHYARPTDSMAIAAAAGTLRRNFQGYTEDPAAALIGFGASSIGSLPQGFVQNATKVPGYASAVEGKALPVARGFALSEDDRLRGDIIEALMCDLSCDVATVARRHDTDLSALDGPIERLAALQRHGLVEWDGAVLSVTEAGRPFVRSVAAVFDAYLQPATTRHASAA